MLFNYWKNFVENFMYEIKRELAEVEAILHETCRNWVKFKHQIGYWYLPLFELKYWLIE